MALTRGTAGIKSLRQMEGIAGIPAVIPVENEILIKNKEIHKRMSMPSSHRRRKESRKEEDFSNQWFAQILSILPDPFP